MTGITPQALNGLLDQLETAYSLPRASIAELAGQAVARAGFERISNPAAASVVVLAGPSFTGAIALAAANQLYAWNVPVTAILNSERDQAEPLTQALADRLELMNGRIYEQGAPLPASTLWIDGLYGIDTHADMDADVQAMIETVNHAHAPIVSIMVPSGLDGATGKANIPTIRATSTVAVGYPTVGLLKPYAAQLVGDILVADVGIPAAVWRSVGLEPLAYEGGQPYLRLPAGTNTITG